LESKQGEAGMDSFSSSSMSSSGSQQSTDAVMEQIKAQLAQAYAQEFMEVEFLPQSPPAPPILLYLQL
jgi:hypothetical protein